MKRFRFDDVCINSDMALLESLTDYIQATFKNAEVIWAVSPLVESGVGERVFDKLNNAFSDPSVFFNVDACGIPKIKRDVTLAGHGLFHIDHRLLNRQAQEMSIVGSCSLLGCSLFVPPFNKWNGDTEDVCREHGIALVKFENGWLCGEYEPFNNIIDKWYFHAREWTLPKFKAWIKGK